MKLTAVLKAESGDRLVKCCGLSGSHACRRCSPYTVSAPSVLNSSRPTAYSFQSISRAGSMPHSRQVQRSSGAPARSAQMARPSNTFAMYSPSGLTHASTSSRNTPIRAQVSAGIRTSQA